MTLSRWSDLSDGVSILAYAASAASGIDVLYHRICRRSQSRCLVVPRSGAVGVAEVGWAVELSIIGEGYRSHDVQVQQSSLACWPIEVFRVQLLLDLVWCRYQVPRMLLRPFLSVSSIAWSSFVQPRFQHTSIIVLSSFLLVHSNLKSIWSWSKPMMHMDSVLEDSPAGLLEVLVLLL